MISILEALNQINPPLTIDLFKNHYSKSFSSNDLNKLVDKSGEIAAKIIQNPGKITLLVGQVQAGKTATYLGTIAHLFDQGSNFIVISPAVDNTLLLQTKTRIEKTFESSKIKIMTINELSGPKLNVQKIYSSLKNNQKIILLSLKQQKRLEDVFQVINQQQVKYFISNPVLIDDEGDQASFDNVTLKEQSQINSKILNIFTSSPTMSLVTITATPMAHILVNPDYPIKPDYCFYLEPGINYFGIEEFVSEENKCLIRISDEDNISLVEEDSRPLPNIFKEALLSFFITAAYIHLRDGFYTTQSMLLHLYKKINHHAELAKITKNAIRVMSRDLKEKYKNYIQKIIQDRNMVIENFDLFLDLINEHIKNSQVIIINSKNQDNDVKFLHNPLRKNYILIGSTMLGRGITIKNLIHTYYTYRSEGFLNADTVLQRARWLGYRQNIDLLRVYMTSQAIRDFYALSKTVLDVNEKISVIQDKQLSFKNIDQSIFIPEAQLKGTRNTVIANSKKKISRYLVDLSLKSSIIAEELFSLLQKTNLDEVMEDQPFRGLEFNDYIDFKDWITINKINKIADDLLITMNDKDHLKEFINKFQSKFFIVNMYTKKNDYRVRHAEKGLIQVAQGRNLNLEQNNFGYVGDRYWYKDKSGKFEKAFIIQIFKFKVCIENNEEKIIYKLSLSMPQTFYSDYVTIN